ncbi:MAG: antibiotic biosynthesis monooxygenase [Burkholderiales bacterium]|jgi:quinol monooxygenase YgiN|nr:antibiotic biosynthesis monooxygenase [Burkholderiales bacterium]
MEVLTVEFRIKPQFIIAFAAAIVENARASRATEPGCHQFDVCRDAADPRLFFLYELYEDEAAIQAHLQTAHFLQMSQATSAWVERKTIWRGSRLAPP